MNGDSIFTPENTRYLDTHPDQYENVTKARLANTMYRSDVKMGPTDDFYTYINRTWLNDELKSLADSPKYYVKDDDFRTAQDDVYNEVIDLVEQHISSKKAGHANIGNLLKSLRGTNVGLLRAHARAIDESIHSYADSGNSHDGLYSLLGFLTTNEVVAESSPIVWMSLPDEKDVTKQVSHLYAGQPSLAEYGVYEISNTDSRDTVKWKRTAKQRYLKYIREVFQAMSPGEKIEPMDVWDSEVSLWNALGGCDDRVEPNTDFYNPMSGRTMADDLGFDWARYATKIGFTEHNTPRRVVVGSLTAISCITALLKESWNSPQWLTYWRFLFYKQMIRFDEKLRDIHFRFHESFIAGQDIKMPKKIYPMFGLAYCFNSKITKLFMEKNYDPETETFVRSIAEDLREIFIRKIRRSSWLTDKTKAFAEKKMRKLRFVVGRPMNDIAEDPRVSYDAKDPWGNITQCAVAHHQRKVGNEGGAPGDTPDMDWSVFKLVGTQVYVVNAYYRPTSNSIYIPQGYIRKPFVDMTGRGIEYNLVYVGYTLGHELCHALDDMGSKFDANGNMFEWWGKADKRRYERYMKNVIRQYEAAARKDGHEFNAANSIGEDLADIGGLSLIEEYLFLYLTITKTSPILQRLAFKELYVHLAVQSRQTIRKRAVLAEMRNNPHPLEKYRCNCPLIRSRIFRTLFEIPRNSPMWWNDTNQIW